METPVCLRRATLVGLFSIVLGLSLEGCGGGSGSLDLVSPGPAPVPAPGPGRAPGPAPAPGTGVFTGLQDFQPAAAVIGQAGFASAEPNRGGAGPDGASLSFPLQVAVGATGRLYVPDGDNRRVLVFPTVAGSTPPISDAAFALGQPDVFQSGPSTDPDAYTNPASVSIGAGKMAVADSAKNRVVIYDMEPADGTARPAVVVGQLNFQENDQACDDTHLSGPRAVHISPDGKLFVADTNHSRILVWDRVPETDGEAATVVLGQSGFTTCLHNLVGGPVPTRASMRLPSGVWSDGTRVAVSDTSNNRILLWDAILMSFPTGQEPTLVLGQGSFDVATVHPPGADTVNSPAGVAFNGTHLAVADRGHNRVLLWDAWPAQIRQAARNVIGQRLFTQGLPNDVGGDDSSDTTPNGQTLNAPIGVTFHQDKLLVTDRDNNRVLVFQSN